jgi:hypothetical protein
MSPQTILELAAFHAMLDQQAITTMEADARITRTALGVSFDLQPGDDWNALLWAAKRALHGPDYDPNGGIPYTHPTGGRPEFGQLMGRKG